MDRNIAIKISGIKKQYKLGAIGGRTLQEELQSWWARKRGKEDPNTKVGGNGRLYGQLFWALNGVDLTIYQGERIGIIGANGAGKSTLLKLLSRITAPTEGEIDIYGRISSMLEVGTGFHRELTGRENIYMNGAILGMSREEIDERIDDIIEFSEIEEFIDTPVKRYSSGMFVKLAFSVAAHLNSEIMIMDEVLAVGDMAFQKKCLDRMRLAADEQGRTILYVSHNMDTIRRLCDRCVVMDKGRIIFDGDVEDAIKVYMDHSLDEDAVNINLKGKGVVSENLDTGLEMEQLTLVNKVTPVYETGDTMVLGLTVNAAENLENVLFRMTLRTDTDVGLATSWSEPLEIEEGRSYMELELPLESLVSGDLYASIGFYSQDEIGRRRTLAHITRAFKFEMKRNPVWGTRAHGYMKLPEITRAK